LNSCVKRLLQRLDHLHLIIWRDQDCRRLLGDNGFKDRHLQRHVPFRRPLIQKIDAERLGGGFRALVHGHVKSVGGQAGNKRDGDGVRRLGSAGDKAGACRSGGCSHHFHK
jgi:hypothetical protein